MANMLILIRVVTLTPVTAGKLMYNPQLQAVSSEEVNGELYMICKTQEGYKHGLPLVSDEAVYREMASEHLVFNQPLSPEQEKVIENALEIKFSLTKPMSLCDILRLN